MNNKTLMWAVTALAVLLVAIIVVVCIKIDAPQGEPVDNINHGDYSDSDVQSGDETGNGEENPVNSEGPASSDEENPSEDSKDNESGGNALPSAPDSSESSKPSSESSSVTNISGNGTSSRPSSGSSTGSSSSSSSSSGSSSASSSTSSSTGLPSGSGPSKEITYEEYMAMSGAEQQEYMMSFSSIEAFFEWFNAAKAKYDAEHPSIEIGGDGSIDLGDIIGGNP